MTIKPNSEDIRRQLDVIDHMPPHMRTAAYEAVQEAIDSFAARQRRNAK